VNEFTGEECGEKCIASQVNLPPRICRSREGTCRRTDDEFPREIVPVGECLQHAGEKDAAHTTPLEHQHLFSGI
jgi:hypothetical protein